MANSKSAVTAEFLSFAFTNPHGGTGVSDGDHDPRFTGVAKLRIVKAWNDEETGLRFVGFCVDDSLKAYLDANANADDQRVFASEHALVDPTSGQQLFETFADSVGLIRTEDGYTFRKQSDGTWGDADDISFANLRDLMDGVTVTVDAEFSDVNHTQP